MPNEYTRRDFLKVVAAVGAGLLLKRRALAELVGESRKNVIYVRPGTDQYERLRQGFIKRISRRPAIIALCKNTEGAAEAIVYAQRAGLPVAIRSGGNSFEGFSCNDSGLVVDLSPLADVEWLYDGAIKVGPACNHIQLYDTLRPKGRVLPVCGGAPAGAVAIGGLALGGGFGYFSRKYGLTCDQLKEVTMVDGKGRLVSSRNNPELLWACRGGGLGNFGAITEMIFNTLPAPPALQFHIFNAKIDDKRATAMLKRWFELTADLPEACFSIFEYDSRMNLQIVATNFEEDHPKFQQMRRSLKPLFDQTRSPKVDLAKRTLYRAVDVVGFLKTASAGYYQGFGDIADCIDDVMEIIANARSLKLIVSTLGGNIANTAFTAASSYPHRSYPYLGRLQAHSRFPERGAQLISDFHKVQQKFKDAGVTAHYANYPDIDFKDWAHAYYGESYPRLRAIKRKYDSTNLIQYEQSVVP